MLPRSAEIQPFVASIRPSPQLLPVWPVGVSSWLSNEKYHKCWKFLRVPVMTRSPAGCYGTRLARPVVPPLQISKSPRRPDPRRAAAGHVPEAPRPSAPDGSAAPSCPPEANSQVPTVALSPASCCGTRPGSPPPVHTRWLGRPVVPPCFRRPRGRPASKCVLPYQLSMVGTGGDG